MGIERGHLDRSKQPQEIVSLSEREAEDFKQNSSVTLRDRENVDNYYYEGMILLVQSGENKDIDDEEFKNLPKAEIIEMSRNSTNSNHYDISLRQVKE